MSHVADVPQPAPTATSKPVLPTTSQKESAQGTPSQPVNESLEPAGVNPGDTANQVTSQSVDKSHSPINAITADPAGVTQDVDPSACKDVTPQNTPMAGTEEPGVDVGAESEGRDSRKVSGQNSSPDPDRVAPGTVPASLNVGATENTGSASRDDPPTGAAADGSTVSRDDSGPSATERNAGIVSLGDNLHAEAGQIEEEAPAKDVHGGGTEVGQGRNTRSKVRSGGNVGGGSDRNAPGGTGGNPSGTNGKKGGKKEAKKAPKRKADGA